MIVRRVAGAAIAVLCTALAAPATPPPAASGLPAGSLAIERGGAFQTWWRSDRAPVRWAAPLPALADAIVWRPVARGIEWGAMRVAGRGEAWRIRVVMVRIDPRLVRIRLDTAFTGPAMAADWSVARAPNDARVAFNAGQFSRSLPWGWVVMRGRQFLSPGHGPLSTAVVIDTSGRVRWIPGDSLPAAPSNVETAFQSYPTLLTGDGDVPAPLRTPGSGPTAIDLGHRDARLALGELRDGRLIVALTRFDALDGAMDFVPFGLTTPEMAALMGALGCGKAVALDGGISSQLLLRDDRGHTQKWHGVRKVPLGLVVEPRS
ncbi:MAG TPA: phosphodiester glycosidase family protein [Gemmatimonadaceae bacterium]|nr:phosphodiester glycosidase family protein [Gemmatimonadaceae bacterium]